MDDLIKIKEPFYSAGKKYGWPYKSIGIGISKAYFFNGDFIKITIGDNPAIYQIDAQKALEIVRQYKSFYLAKETLLGVIPLDLFEKYKP